MSSPRKSSNKRNRQHILLWLALVAIAVGLITLTVFVLTNGQRTQTGATSLSFTEDFTSTTFLDPVSTANWDTALGEGKLFSGQWTNIGDLTIVGQQAMPSPGQQWNPDNFMRSAVVDIGPDDVIRATFSTALANPGIDPSSVKIWYSQWDPVDNRWEGITGTPPATLIHSGTAVADLPGVVIIGYDSGNNPIISVAGRLTAGNIDAYVGKWTPSLGTWTYMDGVTPGLENVSNDAPNTNHQSWEVDSAGNPHISWASAAGTIHYTRWNPGAGAWTAADGITLGHETVPVTGASPTNTNLVIDLSGRPVLAFAQSLAGTFDYFALTRNVANTAWVGLSGVGTETNISNCVSPEGCTSNPLFDTTLVDPATGFIHFVWANVSGTTRIEHSYWDGAALRKMDGTFGKEIVAQPVNFNRNLQTFALNPIAPHYPIVGYVSPDQVHHLLTQWNGTSWVPFEPQAGANFSSSSSGDFNLEYDSAGVPHVTMTSGAFSPTAYISRFTPERVLEQDNVLQSLPVDTTDKNILSATLSVVGHTEGFGGTGAPAPDVPFSAPGRNAFADTDCFMSNNAGLDFYPVTLGDEFTFPTLGTNLVWRCLLDSGTLLDNPVLESLQVDYTIGDDAPTLIINKGVDTDRDGFFADSGEAVTPGQILDYQIQVTNTGSATASNVGVTDALPSGITYVPNSTYLNGQFVPDVNGTFPLTNGLPVGALSGGNLAQFDWSGGPGQAQFGDFSKFASTNLIQFTQPEVLSVPPGPILVEDSFATESQPIQVSSGTLTNAPGPISSVMLTDGRIFVVWSERTSLGVAVIKGRFYNRDGTPSGADISINTTSTRNTLPSVLAMNNGDLVVVWQRRIGNSGDTALMLRRFDSSGTALTGEVILDSVVTGDFSTFVSFSSSTGFFPQSYTHSPVATDGTNIFVSWQESILGCDDIKFRKFDGNGVPLSSEVQINDAGCVGDGVPAMAQAANGDILVAFGRDPFFSAEVFGKLVDSAGTVISPSEVLLYNGTSVLDLGQVIATPTGFVVGVAESAGVKLQPVTPLLVPGTPVALTGALTSTYTGPTMITDQTDDRLMAVWSADQTGQTLLHGALLTNSLSQIGSTKTFPGTNELVPSLSAGAADNRAAVIWQDFSASPAHVEALLLAYEPQEYSLLSSVHDASSPTEWSTVVTHQEVPAGSTLTLELRTGNTPTPDASWSPFVPIISGQPIDAGLSPTRYAQYRVNASRTNPAAAPRLHDLIIGHGGNATITFKGQVTSSAGTVIGNVATVSASNAPAVVTSNVTQNAVLPASSQVIAGPDRISTSVDLSQVLFPQPQSADCVALARSDEPIDALSGSPLASACKGSILLTPSDHVDARVLQEMQRILASNDTVYLLGLEVALHPEIEQELAQAGFTNVRRRGGRERIGTSVVVANELALYEPAAFTSAILANGRTYADALSVASYASIRAPGSTRIPLLLADADHLSSDVKNYLLAHPSINKVFEIGGVAVLSATLDAEVRAVRPGMTSERIAGRDRFVTSRLVADRFFPLPAIAFVASGLGVATVPLATGTAVPVDALVTGPAAAANNAPILLVRSDFLPDPIRDYFEDHDMTLGQIYFVGGEAVIPAFIRQEILDLLL